MLAVAKVIFPRLFVSAICVMLITTTLRIFGEVEANIAISPAPFEMPGDLGASNQEHGFLTITYPYSGLYYNRAGVFTVQLEAFNVDSAKVELLVKQFCCEPLLLGPLTNAPYIFTWTDSVFGAFSLIGRATYASGLVVTTAPVYLTAGDGVGPGFVITSPVEGQAFTAPASVLFEMYRVSSDGSDNPIAVHLGRNFSDALSHPPIATLYRPPYTLMLTNFSDGEYTLTTATKDLNGYTRASPGRSFSVTQANYCPFAIQLVSPRFGSRFRKPATIMLEAEVCAGQTSIAQVEFQEVPWGGGRPPQVLASLRNPPYFVIVSNITSSVPMDTFRAIATDSRGGTIQSLPIVFDVFDQDFPFTANLVDPPDGSVFAAPATFRLEAQVLDNDNNIEPIEFFSGTNLLGKVYDPDYTFTVANLPTGVYTFSARAKDTLGNYSTGSAVTITVSATLANPKFAADGTFGFAVLNTFTNRLNVIDASANLLEWFPLKTNLPSVPTYPFIDPEAVSLPRRFYRLRFP